MKEKILDILEKHYHGRNFIENRCAEELLALLDVSVSFNEGFEAGWTEATSAAIKERKEALIELMQDSEELGLYETD